jgi:hypothetical protein
MGQQVHMLVWANGDTLCIFTRWPIGNCYDFSTMNSCWPIFLKLAGRLPRKMLALAHSVNTLPLAGDEQEMARSCL